MKQKQHQKHQRDKTLPELKKKIYIYIDLVTISATPVGLPSVDTDGSGRHK